MSEAVDELLNMYDADGGIVGTARRPVAKASGWAVGAVNVLLVNGRGQALLQLRPEDQENGGSWDKSVGGHVSAGEDFDVTAEREAREELFDGDGAARIVLLADEAALRCATAGQGLAAQVAFFRAGLHRNLRDVRRAPGGSKRNVLYHVAVYLGRTDLAVGDLRPQASEIRELRYFDADEVDQMLLAGRLAPNMAFLWLAYGQRALALAGTSP